MLIVVYVFSALIIALAFFYAYQLIQWVKQQKNENAEVARIAGLIRSGADAFMRKEYLILALFAGVMAVLIFLFLPVPFGYKKVSVKTADGYLLHSGYNL